MRKFAWMLMIVNLAAGHALAEGRWVKEGATQREITRDHYACLKESRQQVYWWMAPGAYAVSRTPTRQNSHELPERQSKSVSNVGLYRACATARGYVWVNP